MRWWGSSSGDLENLEYHFIAIIPRSILTRSSNTGKDTMHRSNRPVLKLFVFDWTVYKKYNENQKNHPTQKTKTKQNKTKNQQKKKKSITQKCISQSAGGSRTHRLLLCRGVRPSSLLRASWIWHKTIW